MPNRHEYNQNRRIKKLEKKVHKIQIQHELKYNDIFQDGVAITTAGVLQVLNGIQVGDTQITRDGHEIMATSLQLRGAITNISGVTLPPLVRMIVFWDSAANGSTPTVAGAPLTGTQALLNSTIVTTIVFAPYQIECKDRFKVLHDEILSMNPSALLATSGTTAGMPINNYIFNRRIKLNRRIGYADDTNGVSSLQTNSLWVLFIADVVTTATVEAGYRFYFKDI